MNFSRLYLLQTTFYIVLVIVACANRREVGQRLAEVNQTPQPETTSLQSIKFGLKNTTKQAKPEDILVSFNYTRSGNFPKNNTILPINQTTTTTTTRPHGLAARSGVDQQLVTQQLDISTTTSKNRRVNQKTTSIGHQQQQHLQLQSKQNQHQLEKQKQRSQHTSSEYKTKNPTQLNLQRKEIHHRQAIISTTTATTRTTSSAYLQQKLPTTQFPPSSSSSSSPFSSLLSTITPLRIKITTPTFGYVNNGNNHSIVIGNKRPKNYNNYKDKENLQLPNAIQPENVATSNVKAKKSSTVRHNSRSIVRKSSAHTNQPNQPTAFGSQFSLPLSFNIFSSEFWQFFIQPSSQSLQTAVAASTKKPPKKYKPTTSSSAFNSSALNNRLSTKEEKLNYQKPKTVNSNGNKSITYPIKIHDTTTEIISKRNEASFRIAIPTLNRLHSNNQDIETNSDKDKRDAEVKLREKFNCPRENEVRFQLFPKICKIDEDCKVWNRDELCCEIFGAKSCVSGLPKPLEEAPHAPILGLIPRKCPSRPLAELWWEVQECETDTDCWPRICCPDGRKRYCRTSQPELDTVPESVQRSFNYLTDYLECTPPPPPIFDLHPKICTSTLDCFPNVCCQEAGLRHCRPPKKSVFTMLANVFNVEFVKRLTQNIVIK
uniref:WAP domain-containing protein n=1 Tax=Glossina brevipalpis TaxID=37001 RepID=A0A1A9WU82_9MUSC